MSNTKRLILVGPFSPYTSGIAKYNDNLYKALKKQKNISVEAISFKALYPKFLFPGKEITNINKSTRERGVKYLLSYYSPVSWSKTHKYIKGIKPDAVLVTWWTLFWQPWLAFIAMMLRKNNIRVIFICHNLYDHDSKKIIRTLSKFFIKQADAYIVHNTDEFDEITDSLPNKRSVKLLHPVSNTKEAVAHDDLTKRGRLELLFFGIIRPYKGLDVLLDALKRLNDKDLYISIVGEPWTDKNELKDKISNMRIPNVDTNLRFVSDKEASEYFQRTDIVILPYLTATGSGVAAQAFEYGKPVVASRAGGFKDIVTEGKTGWLFEAGNSRQLAKIIKSLDREVADSTHPHITEFIKENSWDNFAKKIITFCTE